MKKSTMIILAILIATPFLYGCPGIPTGEVLPSFKHCSEIDYQRRGTDIKGSFRCSGGVDF